MIGLADEVAGGTREASALLNVYPSFRPFSRLSEDSVSRSVYKHSTYSNYQRATSDVRELWFGVVGF